MKPLVIEENPICLFDRVENPFSTKDIIGRGGNGVVILLKSNGKRTNYVVKILKQGLTEERYKRFVNEIKVIESYDKQMLIENHILPIEFSCIRTFLEYQVGEYVYYGMEKYERVEAKVSELGRQDVLEIVMVLQHILIAIRYLHNHGIAHRDIKMDNVLKKDGSYFLTDFGLVLSNDLIEERVTRPYENIGPIGAPVEAKFHNGLSMGITEYQRMDIYLFGKLCWQLLTGSKHIFEGELVPNGEGYRKLDNAIKKAKISFFPLIKLVFETVVCGSNRRCNLDCVERYLKIQEEQLTRNMAYSQSNNPLLIHYLMTSDSDGCFVHNPMTMLNILQSIKNCKAKLFITNETRDIVLSFMNNEDGYVRFHLDNTSFLYMSPKRLLIDYINASLEIELDDCLFDVPVFRKFDNDGSSFKLMSWMRIQMIWL